MKRVLKYLITAIIIAALVACLAGATWLIGTTTGARWLLSALSRHTDLTLTAKTIEGKLAGALTLDHLDISWPQGHIHVERAEMTTLPLAIVTGNLNIQTLFLKNIEITDNAPKKPPVLEWPRASELISWWSARIGKLEIDQFVYRNQAMQPVHLEKITASAVWKNTQLTVSDIRIISADGFLAGNILAGFSRPILEMNVSIAPSHPLAGMEFLRIAGKFTPGKNQEQIAGNLYISGSVKAQDPKPHWELALDAAMTRQGFPLRKIRLILPDKSGLITGDGILTFNSTEPFLSLQAETAGIDLSSLTGMPAKIAGGLIFRGTSQKYEGTLSLAHSGKNQPSVRLTGNYHGHSGRVTLNAIRGDMMDGTLSGHLDVDWRQGIMVQGALAGRNLNPAVIDKSWAGEINFDLTGRFLVPENEPPSGDVVLVLKESHLHGRQLTGDLRASFISNDVRILRLSLRGKGFALSASGAVNDKLNFTAQASDISRLLPQMSGSLAAQGWVRQHEGKVSGALSARTAGWAMEDWKIAAADIKTTFDDKNDLSFEVNASVSGLSHKQLKAESVVMWFKGSLQDHPRSRGKLQNSLVTLSGKVSIPGTISIQGKPIRLRQSELTLVAGKQGVRAGLNISPPQGGLLRGNFISTSPARLALPDEGQFNLAWQDFNLAFLAPLLPHQVELEGRITGEARGQLLTGQHLSIAGQASVARSKVRWREQQGDILINLQQASLSWNWQDETLSGNLALTLLDHGKLEGRFRLPVAARLPLVIDDRGKLHASLTGQIREKGALSVMFPGLIQESRGDLDIDLNLGGSIAEPQLAGLIRLTKAGGYLPAAGITIKDVNAKARFNKDGISIDSFHAASGPGHVEGSAMIRLNRYRVKDFEIHLNGERFQTIYFPELQVQSSPKLTFSGTPGKVFVRGEVLLPTIQVVGTQARGPVVEASPDVIREGKAKPAAKKLPFELDARVKMILGDSVRFNAAGIDAQLGGSIDLQFQEIEKIISSGEIRVRKGSFRTYGVNLDIVRGRLYYASAPVNQPSLDILALKTIGDVKAGAAVSGTLQAPLIKLYSEPAMRDTDILAYIVLGHPMGSNTDQAAILAMAARALLTSRQAEDLQSQIKGRLGLGSFEISTGAMDSNRKMGYKPVKTTPNGAASSQNVAETMVTVGKYLTPNLYISYGRSLFTGANLFLLRYNLSKNWQVESQTGEASGVDIYYKLEFN